MHSLVYLYANESVSCLKFFVLPVLRSNTYVHIYGGQIFIYFCFPLLVNTPRVELTFSSFTYPETNVQHCTHNSHTNTVNTACFMYSGAAGCCFYDCERFTRVYVMWPARFVSQFSLVSLRWHALANQSECVRVCLLLLSTYSTQLTAARVYYTHKRNIVQCVVVFCSVADWLLAAVLLLFVYYVVLLVLCFAFLQSISCAIKIQRLNFS